jgi:glucose dehydrogenase
MMKRALDMIVAAYGNLFLLLTLQLVLVAGVFVKYKKIAWAQAFCILLVLGQFFSIWLVGLDDMDRHLIPSYPFLMQIGASFLSVVISYLKKENISDLMV